ncbi:MarR family winged helix-turn-helix transcriptional regulator [Streptococcus pneumoniae]|uniref:MarR family winged helix-turn-helix transcriptional regulator n=1 Tax=Streptococcus pneumoniae TaxID=1313 RepID=UPI001BC5AF07|nr:MarR family winged helix-turn-helix transcriptional regulator [Streptococcus pneumoniae]CAG5557977.1 MarR family transcriptional regulator [Streptococcus pneumoniae]
MGKPMLVFKRFGHQIHLMVQKEAKRCGIEFMGGPQGQVVRFLDNREKNQDLVLILVLIKDIEQELNITKSVASNLVKRIVQNGLVELEASPVDKRAKFVCLTDKARSQMQQVKAFFERIDKQLMEDIDEDELLIFEKVLGQLQANIKGIGGENKEISQKN